MEMETRQFGWLDYETHDVIHLEGVESDSAAMSFWLLLADKHHPHLFWLQSVTDATCAMPVCSLAGVIGTDLRHPSKAQAVRVGSRQWSSNGKSCIVLAEIQDDRGEVLLDLERPILIDPHSHRGIRLLADDDQTLQHAPSAKAAPLRKCA
jgi:hypothetical protein